MCSQRVRKLLFDLIGGALIAAAVFAACAAVEAIG